MSFAMLPFLIMCLAAHAVHAAELVMFCKCFCGSNSTIFEMSLMDTKPCANCTKQFCLDNVKDGMCDGIADETCPSNDFKTACFARDSYKDEFIVYCFLILAVGLVLSAAIKPCLDKWQTARRLGRVPQNAY